ncbi:flavin reductase [bacterium]|nr:flavin reductase [bacterium]
MTRVPIDPADFIIDIHELWLNRWLLLACGDMEKDDFNAMTIAWGGMGVMWNKPMVQVVVRPTRHTYGFMERYDSFTVSVFPDRFRDALQLLGSRSGRDGDKIADSGLTPVASQTVSSPGFAEAELIVECRTMFRSDMLPDQFLDASINGHYPHKDYHRIYFGEVLAIQGTDRYRRSH